MNKRILGAAVLGAFLVLAGCKDPAKDAAKASTGEAVNTTSQTVAKGATDFKFDAKDSKIAWTGSKVTGKHDGGFGTFSGTAHVVDQTPEKSSVALDIDVASITSDQEKLTGHLKSSDFFDAAKFSTAKFQSTEVKKGGDKGASHTIVGNLTMHGVTKSISFPANITLSGDNLNVDAEFAVNRKDFGLNYPGKQDDLIRDDVLVKLTIRAKKAAS